MTPQLVTDGRESVYLRASRSRSGLRLRLETGAELTVPARTALVPMPHAPFGDPPRPGYRVASLPALRLAAAEALSGPRKPLPAGPAKAPRRDRSQSNHRSR